MGARDELWTPIARRWERGELSYERWGVNHNGCRITEDQTQELKLPLSMLAQRLKYTKLRSKKFSLTLLYICIIFKPFQSIYLFWPSLKFVLRTTLFTPCSNSLFSSSSSWRIDKICVHFNRCENWDLEQIGLFQGQMVNRW